MVGGYSIVPDRYQRPLPVVLMESIFISPHPLGAMLRSGIQTCRSSSQSRRICDTTSSRAAVKSCPHVS